MISTEGPITPDDRKILKDQILCLMHATPVCPDSPGFGLACPRCMSDILGDHVATLIDTERLAR